MAANDILLEFMADVEAVGAKKVGRDWPDLLVTYNKARIFLGSRSTAFLPGDRVYVVAIPAITGTVREIKESITVDRDNGDVSWHGQEELDYYTRPKETGGR